MLYTKIFAIGCLITFGYLFFPDLTLSPSEATMKYIAILVLAAALPLIVGGFAAATLDHFWYPDDKAVVIAVGGALIAAMILGVLQPFGVTPSVGAAIAGLLTMPSISMVAAILCRWFLRKITGYQESD